MHYKIEVQISDNNSLVAFRNNLKEVDEVIKEWTNPELGYRRFRSLDVYREDDLIRSLCWTSDGLDRRSYE